MATIKQLAEQMSQAFEKRTRINDAEFWTLKDGSPEWMKDVCRKAHDDSDMMPDDWRYKFIVQALNAIAEYEGEEGFEGDAVDSIEADVYTTDLTGWLHSRADRTDYMDQATEEFGPFKSIFDHLQAAQKMEMDETFQQVFNALYDLSLSDDESDED